MSAKKALKKLKKKVGKTPGQSVEQLMRLKKPLVSGMGLDNGLKREVKDISQLAVLNVVSELAVPLNPLLSWFNEGGGLHLSASSSAVPAIKSVSKQPISGKPKLALVRIPLKSPPCKRCPALSHGVCKCAAKKFNVRG